MGSGEISLSITLVLHALCGLGLAAAYLLARHVYGWSLVTHPADTLRLLLMVDGPIVIAVYSCMRQNPLNCSYWKAVGRGLLGLPIGALLNAFGAIVLGAPVGIKYWARTINWSLLMSLFTFVPAACVFGASRADWQRILAHSKPTGCVDYMISVPAHGAVIGAWLGAWPMPLDWERPWQEWPISVTYGTVAGYLVGMLASLVLALVLRRQVHIKGD